LCRLRCSGRHNRITSRADAASVFASFDAWRATAVRRESTTADDDRAAIALVRRFDLGLCTPEALNIAIAQCCDARLLTFDDTMARAVRALGLDLAG